MGNRGDRLKESFDALASRYDNHRRWIVPDFAGFYGAAVEAAVLPAGTLSILDIGAGTGLLSEMLLQACPRATITLLDISERMLEVARRRFAGREGIRFVVADERNADLGGPYDRVVSALSIHHLERDEKRSLYGRISGALRQGGVFVNADEVAGETSGEHRANLDYWDHFLLNGPLGEAGAREIMERRDRLDRMEKVSVQLEWMMEVGFTRVQAVYRNRCFAVFKGILRDPRLSDGTSSASL
jgi:tRNA (cmo5U34)-methyltransferase